MIEPRRQLAAEGFDVPDGARPIPRQESMSSIASSTLVSRHIRFKSNSGNCTACACKFLSLSFANVPILTFASQIPQERGVTTLESPPV